MSKITPVYMDTSTEWSTRSGSSLENPGMSKVTLVYMNTLTEGTTGNGHPWNPICYTLYLCDLHNQQLSCT